jgi:diacylglycerol kinase
VARAIGIAVSGFITMLASERSSRIQFAIVVVAVGVGVWLDISRYEWIALVIVAAMLLSLEAVNTAIEAVVDLASPEYHELAKRAKDVAAGAVVPVAVAGCIVAGLIIAPRISVILGR